MSIGITSNKPLFYSSGETFHSRPGLSSLIVRFEGIYVENGCERLLCLLGRTVSPFAPWSDFDYKPPVADNDQIFLLLRYPHTVNLTLLEIRGEMRSQSESGGANYFDKVRVSSLVNQYAKYQFTHDILK
uniref:DUF2921 domain-containing protein n=1 Tax=Kalanchoe fedtschenkoi TaxID=63787 RepID=A0A7N0V186_KALFE